MPSGFAKIYVFQFVSDFFPITALYAVMFSEHGLSTLEISVLIAAWSVTALALEVPSGAVADRCDRRLVLCFSNIVTAAGFGVWMVAAGFWGYLAGFVLWGAGGALQSGTFQAFVYDQLRASRQEDRYLSVLGRLEATYLVSTVSSAALAAPLVVHGYTLLLAVGVVAAMLGALVILSSPVAPTAEKVEDERYLETLRRGVHLTVHMPGVARCVVVAATTGAVLDLSSEYTPLFGLDIGYGPVSISLVIAGLVGAMAVASALVGRIPLAGARVPHAIFMVGLLVLMATMAPIALLAIALYGAAVVLAQLAWLTAHAELQKTIEHDLRATTTSIAGLLQETANVGGLLAFGVVTQETTRHTAFQTLALVFGVVAVITVVRTRRNHDGDAREFEKRETKRDRL